MFVFVPHKVQCCCQTEKITAVDSCTPVTSRFFLQCSFCLAFVVEVAAILSKLQVILHHPDSNPHQCVNAKLSDWHEETAWLWTGNATGEDAGAAQRDNMNKCNCIRCLQESAGRVAEICPSHAHNSAGAGE